MSSTLIMDKTGVVGWTHQTLIRWRRKHSYPKTGLAMVPEKCGKQKETFLMPVSSSARMKWMEIFPSAHNLGWRSRFISRSRESIERTVDSDVVVLVVAFFSSLAFQSFVMNLEAANITGISHFTHCTHSLVVCPNLISWHNGLWYVRRLSLSVVTRKLRGKHGTVHRL